MTIAEIHNSFITPTPSPFSTPPRKSSSNRPIGLMSPTQVSTPQSLFQQAILDSVPQETPYREYPVYLDAKTKKVRIDLTPKIKKYFKNNKVSVIYQFKNALTQKTKIGQTGDILTRIRRYKSEFNSKKHKSLLKTAITSGDRFTVRVIHIAKAEENIDTLETAYIQKYDSIRSGYNERKGGGGSKPLGIKARNFSPNTKAHIFETIDKVYKSPTRKAYFQRNPETGRIKLVARKDIIESKDCESMNEGFIYKITRLNDDGTEEIYIGKKRIKAQNSAKKTNQEVRAAFRKRMREHVFGGNHIDQNRFKNSKLYKSLNRSPERFRAVAINTSKVARRLFNAEESPINQDHPLKKNPLTLEELERINIEYHDSYENGLNGDKGGGGGG